MTKFRRITLALPLAVMIALIVGAVLLRIGFAWYLGSAQFHRKISARVSQALNAEGESLPLRFDGATVYTDGFAARGHPGNLMSALRADQIRAEFNWRGLLERAWRIDQLNTQRLDVHFAQSSGEQQEVVSAERASPARARRGWHLDLRHAAVEESRWFWGEGTPGSAVSRAPRCGSRLTSHRGSSKPMEES